MSDIHNVLCGHCKVPLEGPVDHKPDSRFSCPSCGAGDTYDNVMREVQEHFQEQTAKHVQNILRDTARGSKSFKFQGGFIPQRTHRFITNLELH